VPHLTIADVGRDRILALFDTSDFKAQSRRVNLTRRFKIEAEAHGDLLATRIIEVYNSPRAKQEISKYTSKTLNVQRRVTDEVAAPLYRHTPARFLDVRNKKGAPAKGSRELNREWGRVLDEGNIKTKAKQWGRYAFIGNVVFVLPVVREFDKRRRLCFETILPQDAGLLWTDQPDVDPETPSILVYRVADAVAEVDDSELMMMDQAARDARTAMIDSTVVYKAIDADGWFGLNGKAEVVERYAVWNHGIPPFVAIRLSQPPLWDYWDTHRGDMLPEVTLEAGRIHASMLWIRKEQQRKLLILKASNPDMVEAGGQATPESSINLWGDANEISLSVLDYETKPDSFVDDIRYLMETALESYGIPLRAINVSSSPRRGEQGENVSGQVNVTGNYSLISMVRDDLIASVTQCELDLAWKVALQLRAGKHPSASKFDPDRVRESARVTFPPMTFADHPLQRAEIYKRKIELGIMTHADALMAENPGRWASREDAQDALVENIHLRNEVAEMLAVHNVPAKPEDEQANAEKAMGSESMGDEFRTVSQAFGAQGGDAKAANRRADAPQE